jgi:hypothetical protein
MLKTSASGTVLHRIIVWDNPYSGWVRPEMTLDMPILASNNGAPALHKINGLGASVSTDKISPAYRFPDPA